MRPAAALSAVIVTVTLLPALPAAAAPAPGSVLSATTAALPAELVPLATGKKITYATTAVTGSAITATGLVLTPRFGRTDKVVAWGHGTTGLADKCAPSASNDVFWPEARTAVAALLAKGWTVAAPDYPGLGTAQAHPYLIGASEGRSLIDAVRAARELDGRLGVQYAIDGHSQGGQGGLFAGELAPSYDGSLLLKAVVSIAPVSNADLLALVVPGTPSQGYLVMGLYGLQAVDASVSAPALLAAPARARVPVLTDGCLTEILAAYQDLTAAQLLIGGALPAAVVAKLAQHDNPAQQPTSAPILLVQGTDDESVPYDLTAEVLLPQLRAYRQPVTFVPVPGGTHDSTVTATATQAADWIAARFAH